jgi:hypothetical protein
MIVHGYRLLIYGIYYLYGMDYGWFGNQIWMIEVFVFPCFPVIGKDLWPEVRLRTAS